MELARVARRIGFTFLFLCVHERETSSYSLLTSCISWRTTEARLESVCVRVCVCVYVCVYVCVRVYVWQTDGFASYPFRQQLLVKYPTVSNELVNGRALECM